MVEGNRFSKKPPEEEKEDANRWLVVVGLIVVGLLIGGGLVFAGYRLTQQQVPTVEEFETPPTPTPTIPSASPSADLPEAGGTTPSEESAFGGWETYTNSDYGYQFKHPAGWGFTVDVVNEDPGTALYVIRQGINSMDIDGYNVLVRAWDNPDGLTLPEWIQFMKDSNAFAAPTEEMDTSANTKVGGEDALQFWSDPISGGAEPGECVQACPSLSVYFVHENRAYLVMLMYTREFDEDSYILFAQILSTFEFL